MVMKMKWFVHSCSDKNGQIDRSFCVNNQKILQCLLKWIVMRQLNSWRATYVSITMCITLNSTPNVVQFYFEYGAFEFIIPGLCSIYFLTNDLLLGGGNPLIHTTKTIFSQKKEKTIFSFNNSKQCCNFYFLDHFLFSAIFRKKHIPSILKRLGSCYEGRENIKKFTQLKYGSPPPPKTKKLKTVHGLLQKDNLTSFLLKTCY